MATLKNMSVVDFSHFQKQKQIFSMIQQIQILVMNLDTIKKIEELKECLELFEEMKNVSGRESKAA